MNEKIKWGSLGICAALSLVACVIDEPLARDPQGVNGLGGSGADASPCGLTCENAGELVGALDGAGAITAAGVGVGGGGGFPPAHCAGAIIDDGGAKWEFFCTGSECECRYRAGGSPGSEECTPGGENDCKVLCTCDLEAPIDESCPPKSCCPDPWSQWPPF
jgi:hypothetical protein